MATPQEVVFRPGRSPVLPRSKPPDGIAERALRIFEASKVVDLSAASGFGRQSMTKSPRPPKKL
jgi:hypothetical protein